jgi:hypothetical protein
MSHQITPESYTTLSEDLLVDIQDIIQGPHNQPVAEAKGLWVALANSVCYAHGQPQGLVVHVVCDTATTAQQLTNFLNYHSTHAPTTW